MSLRMHDHDAGGPMASPMPGAATAIHPSVAVASDHGSGQLAHMGQC